MGHRSVLLILLAALVTGGCAASRESGLDAADQAEASIAASVDAFKQQAPVTIPFFAEAHGYAVFPAVKRAALGIGGVVGRGVLVEQGRVVGEVRVWQFIHGITFGGELHSEVIFFKDSATLQAFKEGTLEFRSRAGIALGPWGAAATPAYLEGVAVFGLSHVGAMVDASVAAANYRFTPFPEGALSTAH